MIVYTKVHTHTYILNMGLQWLSYYRENRGYALGLQSSGRGLGSLDYCRFEGPCEQVMSKKPGHQLFVDIMITFFCLFSSLFLASISKL